VIIERDNTGVEKDNTGSDMIIYKLASDATKKLWPRLHPLNTFPDPVCCILWNYLWAPCPCMCISSITVCCCMQDIYPSIA
jgi:hypothetical protein